MPPSNRRADQVHGNDGTVLACSSPVALLDALVGVGLVRVGSGRRRRHWWRRGRPAHTGEPPPALPPATSIPAACVPLEVRFGHVT